MGDTGMHILDSSTTEQRFKLGDTFEQNGNRYRYIKFGAALAQNRPCQIDKDWQAIALTTATATKVRYAGVVPYAGVSGEYGWVQTGGEFTADAENGLVEGSKVYTDSTGVFGANGGSDVLVQGLTPLATTASSSGSFRAVGELTILKES